MESDLELLKSIVALAKSHSHALTATQGQVNLLVTQLNLLTLRLERIERQVRIQTGGKDEEKNTEA